MEESLTIPTNTTLMTKIKQYYVGPNQVYILAWVNDGAIIEETTFNPHSPRWVKLSDIDIKYI